VRQKAFYGIGKTAFSSQLSAPEIRDAIQKLPKSECKLAVLRSCPPCNFFFFFSHELTEWLSALFS
jgi:hypothetical protein